MRTRHALGLGLASFWMAAAVFAQPAPGTEPQDPPGQPQVPAAPEPPPTGAAPGAPGVPVPPAPPSDAEAASPPPPEVEASPPPPPAAAAPPATPYVAPPPAEPAPLPAPPPPAAYGSEPSTVDRRPQPSSPPIDLNLWIYLEGTHIWQTDPGFDLLSKDDLTSRWGPALGVDLFEPAPGLFVSAELGWNGEEASSRGLFGGDLHEVELSAHHFFGGAHLRYSVLPWLMPHVRVTAGASRTSLELATRSDARLEDASWSPFGGLGAGTFLAIPVGKTRLGPINIGVVAEGGYLLASALDFDLETTGSPVGQARISDFGDLSRSGPYLRTSAFLHF